MGWTEALQHYITFHEWCIAWIIIAMLAVFIGKLWMDVTELKEEMRLIAKSLPVKRLSGLSEAEARDIEAQYAAEQATNTRGEQ